MVSLKESMYSTACRHEQTLQEHAHYLHELNTERAVQKGQIVALRIHKDELEKRVDALEKMCVHLNFKIKEVRDSQTELQEWIDIEDKEPRGGQEVVIMNETESGVVIANATYNCDWHFWVYDEDFGEKQVECTKWLPRGEDE